MVKFHLSIRVKASEEEYYFWELPFGFQVYVESGGWFKPQGHHVERVYSYRVETWRYGDLFICRSVRMYD